MSNRGQVIIGAGLVLFGSALLVANILHINFWAICWPAALILLGIVLLWRPQTMGSTSAGGFHFLGDVVRAGQWPVQNEDFWLFVGDVKFDLRQAELPVGETTLRINGFVGDVDLIVPPDIGVTLSASGFIVDARLLDQKVERFFSMANLASTNYATAERKLRVVTTFFVGDVDIV